MSIRKGFPSKEPQLIAQNQETLKSQIVRKLTGFIVTFASDLSSLIIEAKLITRRPHQSAL